MNSAPQNWTWTKQSTFPSDMGTAHNLIAEVLNEVRTHEWGDKDLFSLEMALEETMVNAVQHGNDSDPAKKVHFDCGVCADRVYARVEDEGEGFNVDEVDDPTDPENLMKASGRGVLLIKHFASRVQWNDRGNVVEFEKDRS